MNTTDLWALNHYPIEPTCGLLPSIHLIPTKAQLIADIDP